MIRWLAHSEDLRVASARLRGELVIRALRRAGLDAGWFDPAQAEACKVLVVGKKYDPATLAQVHALKKRGVKIVFDLCDNRFEYPAGSTEGAAQVERLRQILQLADRVVVSTAALGEIVARECPAARIAAVIGDPTDDLSIIDLTLGEVLRGRWGSFVHTLRTRAWRRQGRTLLVWFGIHGVSYAEGGMADVVRIQPLLEALDREFPLALTIVSNNRDKFERLIRPFALPVAYHDWEAGSFDRILARHDIAVIPINVNAFTRCKSDNRLVTALRAGLAVVADPIPSYQRYAGVVGLGDWDASLRAYLADAPLRRDHVAQGVRRAAEHADVRVVADQWAQVLKPLLA